MEPININYNEEEVKKAIANALENFYNSLINKIDTIDITIMKSKNPYLFRAKAMQKSRDIIEAVLQAFVSSSEETSFGNCFIEPLAITACGGKKSATKGVDIELYDKTSNTLFLLAVKSGTVIFNSSSEKKQRELFEEAQRTLRTSGGRIGFSAIVGYAYGTKTETGRGKAKIYQEVAGEEFWKALTGDKDFYTKIISYMDTLPEQYIEKYRSAYDRACNRLDKEFGEEFCNPDGSINWEKLVDYNSGSPKRKAQEELENNARIIYNELQKNPNISKKALKDTSHLSDSRLNKGLTHLKESGYISQLKKGNRIHWELLKMMEN